MAFYEKSEDSLHKIITNLSEIKLEELLEHKFDKSLFTSIESLEELDTYLDLNFVSYTESNKKEKIKLFNKVLVKSLSLILKYYENESQTIKFKIKWEHLSKLCSYYLEAKSYKSSYDSVRKNDNALIIIKQLFKNRTLTVSDIVQLFDNTKQNTSQLISKLEGLGIVSKQTIGKNTFVSSTSIGIEIFQEYIKERKEEIKNLEDKIIKLFPDKKTEEYSNIQLLGFS